jgi:ribosomal protein S1
MRLLAVCREVHEDVAIFSLPNLWTGYMLRRRTKDKDDSSSSERSPTLPPLDDALEVNQVLSVVVVRAVQEVTAQGHRRRIEVTCAPDRVNSSSSRPQPGSVVRGRVASIEDRGVLIDLGWKRRGFLSFEDIETKYTVTEEDGDQEEGDGGGKVRLTVHRILDFVVSEKVAKRGGDVVSVRLLDRTRMARHTLPPSCRPALADLQPGTLTTVRVEKTVRNGLCVTFGPGGGSSDVFRGAIELSHLGGYWLTNTRRESTDWKSVFEKHKTFPARLLAVDPVTTKIVRLTLQPHLLALQPPPSKLLLPPTGTVVQNCPVIRLDPGLGALLALPTAAPSKDHEDDKPLFDPISTDESYRAARRRQAVYVHISKAMDEGREDGKTPEALFAKQFAPSTVHTVRIIGTANLIEGVASGATAESIVSAHVLTHADLVPGKVMKQVPVYSLLDRGGVLVDFGMGIHGLIPEMHLFDQKADSDFRTKLRKVKYAVGAKVDVRVLSVDPVQKLCTVTAKKSLVRAADAAVIDSFQDARIGQKGTGYVSKVDDQGLAVTFYNGVYGRVTKRSLAAELGVENHKENYHVGDVVQCRVVNKKIKTKRRSKFDQDEDAMDVDGENESRRRVYHELTLSLAMNAEGTEDAPMRTEVSEKERPHGPICLRAGHILPQRSLRVVELVPGRVKERGLVPGYAIVSIKSKYMVDEAESATMPPYLECKLPFEQLLDEYNPSDIETAAALDELGARLLTVGKKINRKGFVLTDPKKSVSDYSSGTGNFAVVSVRPKLVETIEAELNATGMHDDEPKLPGPDSQFYVGAVVRGFVTQLHPRHGAFIRFLDGMTGLVPKLKGGLHLPLFSTVTTKVIALDTLKSPPKILLAAVRSRSESEEAQGDKESIPPPLKIGDQIQEAEIEHLDFYRARVKLLDNDLSENKRIDARIHCTMMERQELGLLLKKPLTSSPKQEITEVHPFHKLKVGTKLEQLRVVSVEARGKSWCVELTNKKKDQNEDESPILTSASQLTPGTTVSGIVTSMAKHGGLWIQLSPRVSAHVPALELSEELDIVRHPEKHFPIGSRLGGVVMDKSVREKHRSKYQSSRSGSDKPETHTMFVSPLLSKQEKKNVLKPLRGDLIIGRIDRRLTVSSPPALMLELRGGFVGRCCVTELEEVDDWTNMPLGHPQKSATGTSNGTDHAAMEVDESEEFEAGRHDDETR